MSSQHAEQNSFLDVYNLTIAPKLREIDIFLKEREIPPTIWQVSQLLDMSYTDVNKIIHKLQIESLRHEDILKLIMSGNSRICGLIRRETERGFPTYYTPDDIAVIYEINVKKIEDAFDILGVTEVNESLLPYVFDLLPADDGYSK